MLAILKRLSLPVLGLLLIAVFIWYAGPYFAFADYHPLESAAARLIAIAIIVACWLLYVLIRRLKAFRASDKFLAAVAARPKVEEARPSDEAVRLRERFEKAVTTLKQQRRDGHSLYDLPWYIFIGAPGSGKTTALLNSGLKFPLEQRVGKEALRGVGGTRNCDWWFTDEAVFLDTAGRYTTQDSDPASDSEGWAEFLALLRKYRARRPVNGVILTINAEYLIKLGDSALEEHVEAARRRLNELNRELRIQLPVYLMVTKCDLVAGFTEYFDDLAHEGRAQVWGVTFRYEDTLDSGVVTQVFPAEFDSLIARLNERVFARIEEVRDPRRRPRIFAFPQQFAAMRDVLARFVSDVFASTQFDQQVLLRGVYFTSGTQSGTPVDRLLSGLGRRFNVAPSAIVRSSGPGKAYFIERLLKEVLIGESGLAGVNRKIEARKAAAQIGAYAAMALAAIMGVVLLSVSYGRNRAFIAQTGANIAALQQVPAVPAVAPVEALVPRFDAVHAVVAAADNYRAETPWVMRWGLYQGESIGDSARDAYVRELDGMLLPRVAARFKQRLQEAPEPEKLFAYLKAYLMLGEPQHLDKKYLQSLVDLEWKNGSGAGTRAGTAVSTHFHRLLDTAATLRPIAVDRALIAQARSSLRQASIPQILYGRIKGTFADDRARALNLAASAGIGVEQVFKRKSGVSWAEPMPSLFTRAVFKEVTGAGGLELVKPLAEDSWVWGEGTASASDPAKLALAVNDLYEQDYIRAWDAMLNDVEFVSFKTVRQLAEALRILTAPTSPLKGLLRLVVDNTTLIEAKPQAAAEPSTTFSAARKKITDGLGGFMKTPAGASPSVAPGTNVTAHFQPIQQLMAGEQGKTPLDDILRSIDAIEQHLGTLGPEVGAGDPMDLLSSPALRALLSSLKQQSQTLPPAIRVLIDQIADLASGTLITDASKDIEEKYQQEVLGPCRSLVANRYPFARDSKADVALADFATVFGPDGVFDRFFKGYLENQVDTSRRPWSWRPGSIKPSSRMLETFEDAYVVREMFFAKGSQTPGLTFWVTVANLDASASRFILQIDGQNLDGTHKGASKSSVVWPGPKPGEAVATFESKFVPDQGPRFTGEWAWFRMVDANASPSRDSQQRVVLSIQSGYHKGQVIVEASSVRNNPFAQAWREFSCES
jgi:type VI secretion system protein ImpL